MSDLNFPGQWTAGLMAMMAGTATIPVVAFGAAANRWSHKALMLTNFVMMSFAVLNIIGLSVFKSELWADVVLLVFGLSLGMESLWYSILRRSFGDKDYGAIFGFWYLFVLIPFMLALILVGYAQDTMHSYIPVFFGLLLLLGLAIAMAAMPSFRPTGKIANR